MRRYKKFLIPVIIFIVAVLIIGITYFWFGGTSKNKYDDIKNEIALNIVSFFEKYSENEYKYDPASEEFENFLQDLNNDFNNLINDGISSLKEINCSDYKEETECKDLLDILKEISILSKQEPTEEVVNNIGLLLSYVYNILGIDMNIKEVAPTNNNFYRIIY